MSRNRTLFFFCLSGALLRSSRNEAKHNPCSLGKQTKKKKVKGKKKKQRMAPPESVHASFIAHSAYLEHHSYCQPEREKKETKKKKGKEIGVGDVSL